MFSPRFIFTFCTQSVVRTPQSVTAVTGPVFLKLGRETNGGVLELFSRFGAQKIEDLSESKIFFAEVFQTASRFVLLKKKVGG